MQGDIDRDRWRGSGGPALGLGRGRGAAAGQVSGWGGVRDGPGVGCGGVGPRLEVEAQLHLGRRSRVRRGGGLG